MKNKDRRKQRRLEHQWLCATRKKEHALCHAPRVARNRLKPGTVVWAHIPYESGDGEKLRPAVVVGCRGRDVQVRRLTSSATRLRYDFYIDVEDLDRAGLDRPCGVDLRDPAEVDLIELVDVAGELSDEDFLRLQVGTCLNELLHGAALEASR